MAGRQTSLQAFFSSDSGSNTESERVGIEMTESTATVQPSESDEDLDSDNVCDPESENTGPSSEVLTMSEGGLEESQELLLQPSQPRLKNFPSKQFGKSKIEYRSFNSKWFDNENWSAWLHWDSTSEKAYCFICRNIYLLNKLTFSKCAETAFISSGFNTWKNATQAFERHRKSACHQEAVMKWHHHMKQTNISAQLDMQISRDQKKNRHCLEMLFTSVEYLARQALPFRGHIEERGNFYQLVALRGKESDDLKSWMGRSRSYMSHDIQNEILQIMAHQILRAIIKDVSSSNWYALIADEATDSALIEQVRM